MNHRPTKPRAKASSIILSLFGVVLLATAGLLVFHNPTPVKASSATLTFTPSADSYTNPASPTTNYGTSTQVRTDGSPLVHAYLRFNVTGITTSTINSITLRLYANSASSNGLTVNQVTDNSWQESQINATNAPAIGTKVGTSKAFSANTWVSINVTPLLKADGTVSIALVDLNATAISLASRETGAHAPQLLVQTTTAATATALPSATTLVLPTDTSSALPGPTATNPPAPGNPPSGDYQPAFPIRAAFYYPWFPEAWNQQGYNPFTNYTPSLGYYDSSTTTQAHISAMTYGNIQAGILSWWGQGSATDQRVATILSATPGSSNPNFRWSIYYENESMGDPSLSQIESDLTYIGSAYGNNASFLKVKGKFVIFVYADANDGCSMAGRWVQADNALGHPAYIVLKVFVGYTACASQPDSWHQYSPAVVTDDQKGYSYAISPGFYKKGEASPRLVRNLTTWTADIKAMVASNEPWQLVTTFNEWGEGTSVESAAQWASASGYGQYLDALHANGNGTPPPQPTATPQSTNPPAATSTGNPTGTALPTNPPASSTTPTRAPTGTQPPQPSPTHTPPPTLTPTGNPTQAPTATRVPPTPTQPTTGSHDPIIFFTSDLVSGASVARAQAVVSEIKILMGQHPGTQMLVASSGDNEQESIPTLQDYQLYFGTTYQTFVDMGIFMQIRGNHDVQDAGHGAAYAQYFGANAHLDSHGQTNYSYNLGAWHFIGLDELNGSVNQTALSFLTSDLAAHPTGCQLVYWHVPTYSSGAAHGDSTGLIPLNQAEYNAGVDIQINGHDHDYQRFQPINPNGQLDLAKGITTFVDGIGGEDGRSGSQTSIAQAASALYLDTFPGPGTNTHAIGVIMFTLHATSADYALYDANNGAILDQGTVNCH